MNELKFLLSFTNSFSLLICNITKLKKKYLSLYSLTTLFHFLYNIQMNCSQILKFTFILRQNAGFVHPDYLWKNDYRICSRRFLLSVALQVKVRKKCNIRLTFQSLLNFFLKHWFKLFRIVGIAHIYGSYIFTTKVIG